jgi:hypothetical protein
MKTFNVRAAQGELLIIRIDALPANLVRVPAENGYLIVGHSETGHHHVMDATHTEMYRLPEEIYECFLVVTEATALEHLRPFDTHEPLLHTPGTYCVRRQREYVPEGFRPAID